MNTFLIYLPFAISLITGCLWIRVFLRTVGSSSILTQIFLGAGLGIAINSALTFLSFIFLNYFSSTFIIAANLIFLLVSAAVFVISFIKKQNNSPADKKGIISSVILLSSLILMSAPLWILGHFYVDGGWDAWSVWNLKAKFLFLGGDHWQNILLPSMWRSSPHYPILLPLTNVWGWTFIKEAVTDVPIFTSFLFTFLTIGLLTSVLQQLTKSFWTLLVAALFFSLPYYLKNSYSQYCDILVAYYLLAAMYCLISSVKNKAREFSFLAGTFVGILSFTKSEGMMAALLLAVLAIFYFLLQKDSFTVKKNLAIFFLMGLAIGALPTIIFNVLYSPGNQTFINGLSSSLKPSSWMRLKIIFMFYLVQFINANWNGLLFIIVFGGLLAGRFGLRKEYLIVPIFCLVYIGTVTFYYYVNTYFEITWWLSVTADRIIYALIPSIMYWEVLSIWESSRKITERKS
jgi:hypothetical protein